MPLPEYDHDRSRLMDLIGDCIWDAYRKWFHDGGTEPVMTARKIMEHINRAKNLPGRFASYDEEGLIDAIRSALRTEVNGGRINKSHINSGTATERIAYSPIMLDGQTWLDVFGARCKKCRRSFQSLPADDVCDSCRVDLEPQVT